MRKPGSDQAWLARGSLDLPADLSGWLDRRIVDLPASRIATVMTYTPPQAAIPAPKDATTAQTSCSRRRTSPLTPNQPQTPIASPIPAVPVMETLDAGAYTIRPSSLDAYPVARITLPEGWNAWQGPNRFDINDPGDSNEEALEEITWYVGILVLAVEDVMSEPCQTPATTGDDGASPEALARAIRRP